MVKQPQEFFARVSIYFENLIERLWSRPVTYKPITFQKAVSDIEKFSQIKLEGLLIEPGLREIEAETRQRVEKIGADAPFTIAHNADYSLAKFCYIACRMIKPAIVVETGVGYGVTSAFILKSLEVNGNGTLHSIDLPPIGALNSNSDSQIGILVPEKLKQYWRLYRGTSKNILPQLLQRLQKIDIFLHDSLHTYKTMHWEFQKVKPFLTQRSAAIADDIDKNRFFLDWANISQPVFWTVVSKEDKGLFGISLF